MISFKLNTEVLRQYKVWHIPQVPEKPFELFCDTLDEAIGAIRMLARYDEFQYKNKIKPDYANMSGVQIWSEAEGEWVDWYLETDEDFYDDIWVYISEIVVPAEELRHV